MRAMSDRPSIFIEPFSLAKKEMSVERSLPFDGMDRLSELVLAPQGEVAISLHFGIDPLRKRVMHGTVSADVVMRCERCLQDMQVKIIANVNVGLVKNHKQAKELPEEYEPLLLESDEPISLSELAEDELILSLPIAPRHESKDTCIDMDEYRAEDEPQEEKKNPFAALAALKEKH